MVLGAFVRRALTAVARRNGTYRERVMLPALLLALVGACTLAWDEWGWDRASVVGAQSFGIGAFGLAASLMAALIVGGIPPLVAPAIAVERDRKSLDALLATALSPAEIVIGTLAAGLLRACVQFAVALPVVVLIVYMGGVDVRWALLAGAGLASTALALGALAVMVSAGARTARRATGHTLLLAGAWFIGPAVLTCLFMGSWTSAIRWTRPAVLAVLDSSPFAIALNVVGIVRRTSLPGAVLRMVALQTSVAALLIGWACWRLRPASRAVHDGEGRSLLLRSLRTRRGGRPPCGDDPVLWNEIHGSRGTSNVERLIERIAHVVWIVAWAMAISWFALPATGELLERGYVASSEALRMPEAHPVARLMVQKLTVYGTGPAAGQARLEFNIVLRQATALFSFILVLVVAGAGAEGIAAERERDTWLGLLATPLTGSEIVRAKILGAVWRGREVIAWMVGAWVVGLATGALHPLGFLAGTVQLAAICWLFAAIGTYASLCLPARDQAVGCAAGAGLALSLSGMVLLFLPDGTGSVLLGAGSPPFLAWSGLLSFEDVHAALHSGAFPQLASAVKSGEGAAMVAAAWVIGVAAQLVGAWLVTRAACRSFDAAVGRPCRQTPPRWEFPETRLAAPANA